jgi:arsenate reductase (thioredoxin)
MRYTRCWVAFFLSVAFNACSTAPPANTPLRQILFVCEHGNVKSLMAASYFNEAAQARRLPYRAVSRASALDSDNVPDFVKAPLAEEGFDVSAFRPRAVTRDDVAASDHVISISTTLPVDDAPIAPTIEQWNDIPAASADFAQSRAAIKAHIAELLQRLESEQRH